MVSACGDRVEDRSDETKRGARTPATPFYISCYVCFDECPRQDSNLRVSRFRKPPLYPTELRGRGAYNLAEQPDFLNRGWWMREDRAQ